MYPTLTAMIQMLAADNDMRLKPVNKWQWPDNAPTLEKQASSLSEDDQATMVYGEYGEMEVLVKKYNLGRLNHFINEVFDGELQDNFCIPYKPRKTS